MLKSLILILEKDLVGIPSRIRAAILLEINPIISQSTGIFTPLAMAP
jgi:hypothetical protein